LLAYTGYWQGLATVLALEGGAGRTALISVWYHWGSPRVGNHAKAQN